MKDKEHHHPSKWGNCLLEWFCHEDQLEIFQGDLYEIFESRIEQFGPKRARLFFLLDVLGMLRPYALKRNSWYSLNNIDMVKNYFKITCRNFLKQKVYSTINISGLAIGLACSLLIYLYVLDELSYDTMHSKSDRIYRIPEIFEKDGVGERSASNPFALGPAIANEYPHLIDKTVRFFNFQAPVLALKNTENNREFNEQRLFLVDSTLFDVFDYELTIGNKETALDGPNSILLTQTTAAKYFGEQNPLGKTLQFQGDKPLAVTGVLKDVPLNTHFQFDGLISYSTVNTMLPATTLGRFYWNPCWTYLLIHDNDLKKDLEDQLPLFVKKYYPEDKSDYVTLQLQPLRDIHLTSNLDYEIRANGNKNNVYVFGTIAIFVLLIACINFINLSTARATKRAKEVGIRKTLGSKRAQLVNQFLFESILYTMTAGVVALGIVLLTLPYFNAFTEKSILLFEIIDLQLMLSAISLILFVGIVSGLYPALVLSSFEPVKVLKGGHLKSGGLMFRKVLVTAQFAVTILLLAGTIIALKQLNLLQDNNLGFDREQIVMVTAHTSPIEEHFETLRQELERSPDIISVTAVEEVVGAKSQVGMYQFEGMEAVRPFPRLMVRYDFIETFGMELAAGRSYSKDYEGDNDLALLVNESLVRSMNWGSNDEAIGRIFKRRKGRDGRVIGVVKDFNYASKHVPIAPLIMDLRLNPGAFDLFIKYIAVRVSGQNVSETLSQIEGQWKTFVPDRPFEHFFLDSRLEQSYKDEIRLSQLTSIFSGLAIFVACLGLFGLTTFITEQRTKEIGIRKVLGIKSIAIISLLSRDFIHLIGVAFVITIPIAYYLLDQWLSEFAYRIPIGFSPFVIAGLVILIISMVTVSYHGLRAISINPVLTLKDE